MPDCSGNGKIPVGTTARDCPYGDFSIATESRETL